MHGMIEREARKKREPSRVVFHNVMGEELGGVSLGRRRRRLASVVGGHAQRSRPFVVSVHKPGDTLRPSDHTVRLRREWKVTRIEPGDVVLITYLPLGSGGGETSTGKQIGMAVAVIALAVAAPYAVGAAVPSLVAAGGGLTFAGQAVAAGIVIGGSYLLSLATKAKANKGTDDTRPLYGVSGGGNQPRAGDRIPLLYGRCWTQPDLSQPDYSVYDGEDQILYKRLTLGLGKYQVHTLMLGTAVLWTSSGGVQPPFTSVPGGSGTASNGVGTEVEFISPGGVSTLVPGSVYSAPEVTAIELPRPSDIPNTAGPFPATPLGQQASRLQIDYSLPQGVFATRKSDGDDFPFNWSVEFEYAPCDDDNLPTGPFTALHYNSGTLLTKRAQRFTRYVDVAPGRYLVRARNPLDWFNVPEQSNETDFGDGVNSVIWDGLRAHFAETIVRPHVTEIAMRVRSGKGLGITAFADLWVEATRILPVWNGLAWVEQPTRKAVYAFKDILQASYGAGLADGEVDLERIKFYAANLSANDSYDGVIRGPVSVWEASASVLGTMRAEPARIGNTWSLNRDEAKAARKHVFSRRQVIRSSTTTDFKIARNDGAADVIVEYSPGGDPRRRRNARVTFGSETVTPRRINLAGVTSHDHAHHLATWLASSAYYRRERRKIAVNRQGRIVGRGDPVLIDSWFMSGGKSGGVMSRAGNALTLDTPIVIPASPAMHAMLRNRRAEEFGPILVTQGASPYVINLDAADLSAVESFFGQTLTQVLALDDEAMTSVMVSPLTELADSYLIDAVTPQGREVVNLEAVNDAQGVWDALGEATPPVPPIPSGGDIYLPPYPVVPWLRARAVQQGAALVMEWAVGRARGAARYVVQASLDENVTWETVSEDLSTSGTWPLRHLEHPVHVGAFAVSGHGTAGPTIYTAFETFVPLANGNDIQLMINAFNSELQGLVTDEFNAVAARIEDLEHQIARHAAEFDMTEFEAKLTRRGNLKTTQDVFTEQVEEVSAEVNIVKKAGAATDLAFASYSTSVNAKIGPPGGTGSIQASVTVTQNAFVDHVAGAFAQLESNVEAKIGEPGEEGSVQASVTENATAIATLDGFVSASWGVTLNANGWISGIQLINQGETLTTFDVSADVFRVAYPTVHGPVPMFTIANVSGSPRVTMRADMLADGVITAREINTGAITTIKLDAQAVTTEKITVGGVQLENILEGAATASLFVQGSDDDITVEPADDGATYNLVVAMFEAVTSRLVSIDFNLDLSSLAPSVSIFDLRLDIVVNGSVVRTAVQRPTYKFNRFISPGWNFAGHAGIPSLVWTGSLGPAEHTIVGRLTIEYQGPVDAGGPSSPTGQTLNIRAPVLRAFEGRR